MLLIGAALALSILLFVPGLLEQFEAPKAAAVSLCGVTALGMALARGNPLPGRWQPLDVGVAIWLSVEALATVGSISPLLSLYGEPIQREGLVTSVGLAGLYVAARNALQGDPARVGHLARLVVSLAVIASAYALLQAARIDPLHWGRTATYGQGDTLIRPFGTLGHPNLLGVAAAAGASVALAWVLDKPRSRWLYGPALAVCISAAVLSFSRGAWLGLVAGLASAALLALRARATAIRIHLRALILGGVGLVALTVLFIAGGWGDLFTARILDFATPGQGSAGSRLEIWKSAIGAWGARPLLGHGPDTFELTFPRFQTPRYWLLEWGGLPFHAHSIYLQTLATRGIAGILAGGACVAALLMALRGAWRRGGAARAVVAPSCGMITSAAVCGLFGAIGVSGALLVVLALAFLGSAGADPGPQRAGSPSPPWRTRIAGVAVGATAAIVLISGLGASREAATALRLIMIDAPPRGAVTAAERARKLSPNEDRYPAVHAEALLLTAGLGAEPRLGLGEAARAARDAIALAPLRASHHQLLGRVLAARAALGEEGAVARTQIAYRRALLLAPVSGLVLEDYARQMIYLGIPTEALSAIRRERALYPERAAQQWRSLSTVE